MQASATQLLKPNIVDVREIGTSTTKITLVPRPRPALIKPLAVQNAGGSGECSPRKFWNF